MDSNDASLCASHRFLVRAVEARGGRWELLDFAHKLLEVELAGKRELFIDIDASSTGYPAATVARDKGLTKQLLQRAGLPVPEGRTFTTHQLNEALLYGRQLGFPVVVKSANDAGGMHVHLDLRSAAEVEEALTAFMEARPGLHRLVVERHLPGSEHRVFLTRTGRYAVLSREPASVVGNGELTVGTLAMRETERRMNPRRGALGPLVLGPDVLRHLARTGRSILSVPAAGERVFLRANSNVSTGGVCRDATRTVHPSVLSLCAEALACFPGLPFAGIDFLTHDLTAPQEPGRHAILEVNVAASIGMHMVPAEGEGRDLASEVLELVFGTAAHSGFTPIPPYDGPPL